MTFRIFSLLLWVHYRSLLARFRAVKGRSTLLITVLGLFTISYLALGYFLFYYGLSYIYRFPLVGVLLSQRILFLIFAFFFLMLIFSNLIVGYTTLFKNGETTWFLTLPIRHLDIYRWKFLEALVVSSWALLFLSAPLMAAYGRVHEAPWTFYLQVILLYVPFVVLPGAIGSWVILLGVRFLARRWMKKVIIFTAIAMVVAMIVFVRPVQEAQTTGVQGDIIFNQLLTHTRHTLNPMLPSAWMANAILNWSDGLTRHGAFYFLVLLSNAMLGTLLGFQLLGRLFYPGFTSVSSSRSESYQRKAVLRRTGGERWSLLQTVVGLMPFGGRPDRALLIKDARVFWRDPAQWTQFMIFFGLLGIYVMNLRNVAFDFESAFWGTMISYLNLTACSLTLSTLTTRFVFPQFSLEGKRLWIIGLAPLGIDRVMMSKFWSSFAVSSVITGILIMVSSLMLKLSWSSLFFFCCAITVMSATLCGLAVGLGSLFPNLKEENPSKIVSGFGGTLCLVTSFVYISAFIGLLAVPASLRFSPVQIDESHKLMLQVACYIAALLVSLAGTIIPLSLARRRVKNLEV